MPEGRANYNASMSGPNHPSSTLRHRRRAWRRTGILLTAIVLVVGVWTWEEVVKDRVIPKRWGVVEDGIICRSGQLSASLVKRTLAQHGIEVIVDLTGEVPGDRDQRAERKAAQELGIEVKRFPLSGDGTGDLARYAGAVEAVVRAVEEELARLSTGGLAPGELERTVARVTLDRKAKETGQTVFELEQEAVEALPEEGLDAPYLVRQLLDVVPNPWQGMRLLEETLATLREQGVSDEQIYVNRLDLVQAMKTDLREQVNAMAESLFRKKLDSGEVALRLVSSKDPALNWKIAETLELEVAKKASHILTSRSHRSGR